MHQVVIVLNGGRTKWQQKIGPNANGPNANGPSGIGLNGFGPSGNKPDIGLTANWTKW